MSCLAIDFYFFCIFFHRQRFKFLRKLEKDLNLIIFFYSNIYLSIRNWKFWPLEKDCICERWAYLHQIDYRQIVHRSTGTLFPAVAPTTGATTPWGRFSSTPIASKRTTTKFSTVKMTLKVRLSSCMKTTSFCCFVISCTHNLLTNKFLFRV